MNFHKVFDCTLSSCVGGFGLWVGDHYLAIGGAALLTWRLIQAFILEPMGIFWPQPRRRRRT
jgi:hypothetical protein